MIGPGNRLAHAAALAVAESPGEAYNPLFLHGPPGLGKTHLLGAIVEYLRRNHPELEVHYTTAERFTTEFVAALRRDGPGGVQGALSRARRAADRRRPGARGQAAHRGGVRPHLQHPARGRQADRALVSDRPPEALSKLAERLRDRFNWGLRVELEPPDLRTRIAVLWRIASGLAVRAARPPRAAGDRHQRARERPRARGRDDQGDGDRLAAQRAADHPDRAPRPRPGRAAPRRPPSRRR